MFNACINEYHDGCDLYNEKVVTARKPYRCEECGDPIEPGQEYEYVKYMFEDYWGTFRTCITCRNIRRSLFRTWLLGNMWEVLLEEYGGFEDEEDEEDEDWWIRP
jgi:hypothetical protein